MIEERKSSITFSDDAIRRFLLRRLAAREQSAFEQTLMADDDLESRVRLAEVALADDYARGLLTGNEERQFRESFLVTDERKQMLGVSETLNRRFRSSVESASLIQNVKTIFDFRQPVWRYAFAALILLLVFSTVWRKIKEPIVVGPITPKRVVVPKPSATQSPIVAHHPTTSPIPNHVEESTSPPDHQIATPAVVLDGNNSVGNPFELKLRDGNIDSLRAQIVLGENHSTSYRVELWDSKGESLFTINAVAARDGKVIFDIPSRNLSAGEYLIRLKAVEGFTSEETQSYYFRITR